MIDEKNIEKTKLIIKKSERPILIKAQEDEYNRKILEYGKFDFLIDIERGKRKNTLRNIDSGFNNVLASIAYKNKIGIGIDIGKLSELNKLEKAKILERIRQNIKIAKKKNVLIRFFNIKDKKDAFSLMLTLGASTLQAKKAISF